jgi:hypothetical protein
MSDTLIKLNNGLEVHIDEFIKWSEHKQRLLLMPVEQKQKLNQAWAGISDTSRPVVTPKGMFATVDSAAKALNIGVDGLRKYLLNDAYPEYRYVVSLPEDDALRTNRVLYNGVLRKSIKTPLGIFKTVNEAAKAHNFSGDQIKLRLHSDKHPDFYRTDEVVGSEFGNGKATIVKKTNKKTVTPLGVFDTKVQAMKAHNLSRTAFTKMLAYNPKQFYFLED